MNQDWKKLLDIEKHVISELKNEKNWRIWKAEGKIRSDKISGKKKNEGDWKSKTMYVEYSSKNHMKKGDQEFPLEKKAYLGL